MRFWPWGLGWERREHTERKDASRREEKTVKAEGGLQNCQVPQGSGRTSPKDRSHGLRSARRLANYKSTWDRGGKEHGCTSRGPQEERQRGPGRKKNQQDADGGGKKSLLEGELSTPQIDKIYVQGQQRLYGEKTSQMRLSREQSRNKADKKNPDRPGGKGKTPHIPQTHWPPASLIFNWPFTFQGCPTPQPSQLRAS